MQSRAAWAWGCHDAVASLGWGWSNASAYSNHAYVVQEQAHPIEL